MMPKVKGFAMVSYETIYRWIWDDKCKKSLRTKAFGEKERSTTSVETKHWK